MNLNSQLYPYWGLTSSEFHQEANIKDVISMADMLTTETELFLSSYDRLGSFRGPVGAFRIFKNRVQMNFGLPGIDSIAQVAIELAEGALDNTSDVVREALTGFGCSTEIVLYQASYQGLFVTLLEAVASAIAALVGSRLTHWSRVDNYEDLVEKDLLGRTPP